MKPRLLDLFCGAGGAAMGSGGGLVIRNLEELAKRARNLGAAPDYDEEAIREALWAVVDAVLERSEGRLSPAPDPPPPCQEERRIP